MLAPSSLVDLSLLPGPNAKPVAVRLTPPGERAVRAGHPWIFASSVRSVSGEGRAGDVAAVFDRKNRFLAVGLLEPDGPIRVRVLQTGKPAKIGPGFFAERLGAALAKRTPLRTDPDTTGYRLVHGESDGFPGLVLDRYGDACVLKLYSPAWVARLRELVPVISGIAAPSVLVGLVSRRLAASPGTPQRLRGGSLLLGSGNPGALSFRENGLSFEAHPFEGQKTGFYLDQRENRARLEALTNGARVLNVFSYTGGFSVYAARGGAREVVSVDQSAAALDQAERHFELARATLGTANHSTLRGDAFDTMARLRSEGRRFDVVIVDPPSFAKEERQRRAALDGYGKLTRLALGVLTEGGLLVQASCSSRVPADSFFARVHDATRSAGRRLEEIERTGHPADHPLSPGFPEGAYLKCMFARVS